MHTDHTRPPRRTRGRVLLPLLVVLIGLGAAACGNDGDPAVGAQNEDGAAAKEAGTEAVDQTFVSMMMPHHEMAIQMGTTAAKKGSTPEVKQLGQKIADDQKQEMTTLEGLARDLDTEAMTMPAPITAMEADMMQRLEAASGTDFDRMFLESMRMHHAQAVAEAELEMAGGTNDQAKALAEKIREAQLTEIDQMNGLLAALD